MPPRLNKRQQRELEELEELKATKPEQSQTTNDVSDDEDELPGPSVHRGSAFSNLFATADSDEEDEEDEDAPKSRKSKKKKKKSTKATPVISEAPTPTHNSKDQTKGTRTPVTVPPRNEKKALKKARAKEKKKADDELDQALAELSVQYPSTSTPSQSTTTTHPLHPLLSVSLQHLDADAEMRRFFGSRVVTANRDSSSSSSHVHAHRKKGANVKSNLVRPQGTWWPASAREGLSLRALSEEEVWEKGERHGWGETQETEMGKEKWWTVEYSKKYTSMTRSFMDTVLSGDPQGFWDLLSLLPWHADNLLQISEVYRHRDEHAQAVDFIDRALFTYERAFIGSFTFTTGSNRLDFDRVENRPFFLALHRQVTDLQRRGCVRTSFEFARLMYSIDPWTDPHGALLHLDFLAIKAGMGQWLVDVYDLFEQRRGVGEKEKGKKDGRFDPSVLPGWAYARALALKVQEDAGKEKDHTTSTKALTEAVFDFPTIVPLLADKLDVSLPGSIRAHRDFKVETDGYSLSDSMGVLHLLSHLYAQRSAPIWKDHAQWFSSTVTTALASLPSSLPPTPRHTAFFSKFQTHAPLRYSVYRHIMVLETSYKRLFSFIPKKVMEAKSLACDPLPPLTRVSEYDAEFFKGVEEPGGAARLGGRRTRREREADERRLAQLIPDAGFRQQLQGFFDAHPQFNQRFPGGILQFAQMAGQLPPEVLEDLMVMEVANPGVGAPGAMPGGLDNMQDGDEEFEFEDEDGVREGMVQVRFVPAGAQVPAPGELAFPPRQAPVATAGPANHAQQVDGDEEEDEEEDENEEEEDDEEEYISPMPRMLQNIIGRFWGRNAQAEESSSEDEAPLDDTGVD